MLGFVRLLAREKFSNAHGNLFQRAMEISTMDSNTEVGFLALLLLVRGRLCYQKGPQVR